LDKKRLFVAIDLPDEVRSKLQDLQRALKPFARDAKWVNPAGIHLTIKFLGATDVDKIPALDESLNLIAKAHQPLAIHLMGCGFFPNLRRPNVLWAGVIAPDLAMLQQSIEHETARLGFEKENRPFTPHLTLARFKNNKGLLPPAKETEKYAGVELASFVANRFVLFDSILHRQGAEYHKLGIFHLAVP